MLRDSKEIVNVHDHHLGAFNTASGLLIDLNAPHLSNFEVKDIAIGLGNICRFGGQINRFYSVAQHSVFVMHLAPDELKRAALMHDASEAYLGDVIKPLKIMLGKVYEELETRVMYSICLQHEVNPKHLARIKEFDKIALELEHEALQKQNPNPLMVSMNKHGLLESQSHFCWDNTTAAVTFYEAYVKLWK